MASSNFRCRKCNSVADAAMIDGRITNLRCPSCKIEVSGSRAVNVVREALWHQARSKALKSSLKSGQVAMAPNIEFLPG